MECMVVRLYPQFLAFYSAYSLSLTAQRPRARPRPQPRRSPAATVQVSRAIILVIIIATYRANVQEPIGTHRHHLPSGSPVELVRETHAGPRGEGARGAHGRVECIREPEEPQRREALTVLKCTNRSGECSASASTRPTRRTHAAPRGSYRHRSVIMTRTRTRAGRRCLTQVLVASTTHEPAGDASLEGIGGRV